MMALVPTLLQKMMLRLLDLQDVQPTPTRHLHYIKPSNNIPVKPLGVLLRSHPRPYTLSPKPKAHFSGCRWSNVFFCKQLQMGT